MIALLKGSISRLRPRQCVRFRDAVLNDIFRTAVTISDGLLESAEVSVWSTPDEEDSLTLDLTLTMDTDWENIKRLRHEINVTVGSGRKSGPRNRKTITAEQFRADPFNSVKPLEFYRLGVLTVPGAVFEPQQRTVVNRLYYGLHHEACCRYFRKFPWSQAINSNRRHTDLRIRFSSSDDPISKTVGSLLGDLMRLRTEADYRLVQPLRFRNRSMDVRQLLSLGRIGRATTGCVGNVLSRGG